MLSNPANTACTAYTRYVLDVGQSEDWLALQMALAPCLLGYGAVAKMLLAHAATRRDGNPYWPWIQNYAADDYVEAVALGSGTLRSASAPPSSSFNPKMPAQTANRRLPLSELLERNMRLQSPSRIEELVEIFLHGTKVCHLPAPRVLFPRGLPFISLARGGQVLYC